MMKIRRLQRLNDQQEWVDCAYGYERPDGSVGFRFNVLTWGRVGDKYTQQIQENSVALTAIETIITPNEALQWLPVEEIAGDDEAIKAQLDETCGFPKIVPVVEQAAA